MNYLIFKVLITIVLLQNNHPNKNYLLTNGFVASGYDVVSYFDNKPMPGKDAYIAEYEQVKFKFSSEENLKTFKANPKKYVPKYGGWCAYAIGLNGKKVTVDPKNYRIFKNQLFLFYKTSKNDTLKDWLASEEELFRKAELNWSKIH
ncbi:MAG TPA: YHS domain-containing (seleno)protein [Leadbetterella sp.]|nr:YHS domain-containing (seleno)protein [Leadbetterella sp.]